MFLSLKEISLASAMLAVAHAQGIIVSAKGDQGTSTALQVDQKAGNDANFISQTEIVTNVVNECGRTLLAGNIDIGEQTETALLAKQVTTTTAGGTVQVSIAEGGAQGVGPYVCDLDLSSNANGANGQTNLTVKEAAAKNGQIALTVTMPADLQCVGASTGDVCTVRCRNAQEFGGCFAVQQTDVTPKVNEPGNIETAQTLDGVLKQVAQNIKDLPAASGAIATSSLDGAEQGVAVVDAILGDAADVSAGNATAGAGNNNAGKAKAGKAAGKAKAGKAAAGGAAGKAKAGKAAAGNAAAGNAAAGKAKAGKAAAGNAAAGNAAAGNAAAGNAAGKAKAGKAAAGNAAAGNAAAGNAAAGNAAAGNAAGKAKAGKAAAGNAAADDAAAGNAAAGNAAAGNAKAGKAAAGNAAADDAAAGNAATGNAATGKARAGKAAAAGNNKRSSGLRWARRSTNSGAQ